ncbi:hypothetical protein [Candidatus Magnetaquicoccus inordinatus]|uniref:hypothetical protein n=1 Tax=Candidatus Magnetaquicoccus inordinatus TaxID=2496818 RepID=UPI00102BC77F|nr:hypothetical protein [Candidatus Magnetaquicoccus inordinatus]
MKQGVRIPLFIYLLFIYNAVIFADAAVTGFALESILYRIALPSGATLLITIGESLLFVGLIAWYAEWMRMQRGSETHKRLSLMVLLIFLLEGMLVAKAATAVFFSLLLMDLLLVIGSYSLGINRVRQDLSL